MDDLISRQAAIDVVAEGLKHVFVEYRDVAEKLISKLPTVAISGNGKGVYIPEIAVDMLRNASLESIETLLAEGTMYDIDLTERVEKMHNHDIYIRGYNDAKREVALSGEYERCYKRGKEDFVKDFIRIIDDMRKEGIIDFEQAREFRMRVNLSLSEL